MIFQVLMYKLTMLNYTVKLHKG